MCRIVRWRSSSSPRVLIYVLAWSALAWFTTASWWCSCSGDELHLKTLPSRIRKHPDTIVAIKLFTRCKNCLFPRTRVSRSPLPGVVNQGIRVLQYDESINKFYWCTSKEAPSGKNALCVLEFGAAVLLEFITLIILSKYTLIVANNERERDNPSAHCLIGLMVLGHSSLGNIECQVRSHEFE
jgi:hypothetical protein